MIFGVPQEREPSILLIEGVSTALVFAVAFCWPRIGSSFFGSIERAGGFLAHKQGWTVFVVGATAFLLRLALLPLNPIPHPFVHDDFSFLLASDTFALGRLTNPTPTMWKYFESFHITMHPTYMTMYFPAQGLLLAAGKVLVGNSWFGLLFVTALMCAAVCWMLQAWLPPKWALLGGMLIVMRLGLFSYWIDTYSGGGSVAALGGAIVLGAFPRLMGHGTTRHALLLATGIIVLALSRPYEGLLLCIPVAVVMGRWFVNGRNRPSTNVLFRRLALPVLLLIVAGGWMAYYNDRAFGDPLIGPYTLNRATYAVAPHFIWQSPRSEPHYRYKVMREFYVGWELNGFERLHTARGFSSETLIKLEKAIIFYAGILFISPFIMLRRVCKDRRTRFLLLCVLILCAGMLLETWFIPHYIAPFTAAFYALGLQAARHLRLWRVEGRPVGIGLVRLTVLGCIILSALRAGSVPLGISISRWPCVAWYGSEDLGVRRAQVETAMEQLPGHQLAIVRYSPLHSPFDEWVYNAPDIDKSKVVWARELQSDSDLDLIHYYKDRKVWLVQPDTDPVTVSPYRPPVL